MISFLNSARFALVGIGCCLGLSACEYEDLPEADYPQQVIYMPTARNGVFSINSLPPATGTYRFTVNLDTRELVVPLGVFRGGVSTDGNVAVTITANADTVNQLISAKTLTATTLLPTDKFTLPTMVTLGKGRESAPFDLRINLDYLRTLPVTPGQQLAVGVTITSTQTAVNPRLKTTVISLDPAIVKPTPDFTFKAEAAPSRKITFTNTSKNALNYTWDFGDGSPTETSAAPTHTYAAAGTYTVTLTAVGITGNQDVARKTMSIRVL
jgi:hypothetical protein